MSKPRSTRIRKGVEIIDKGRRATVVRTTTLNVHGPMADVIYQDDESMGCVLIANVVRADEVAEPVPATVYVTVRVNSKGKPLAGMFERKYRTTSEARAAEHAASNSMTRAAYGAASVSCNEDGVWTFTPSTGSPVHIRVTELTADDAAAAAQEAAEQAEADEHEGQQLAAVGAHEETLAEENPKAEAIAALFGGRPPEQRCPRCAGLNGHHGSVHVRHGNGGGHNEPCPNTPADPAPEGPRSECCGEPMTPEQRCENCGGRGTPELQTWDDADVVARTELLHPITHPYRANEVVEYHGPSGVGPWVHGPMHFRRITDPGVAEIMTMSGPVRVDVADLRRPSGNIAIELAPEDVARIFQALALEAERLAVTPSDHVHAHTVELRDRFAALHP